MLWNKFNLFTFKLYAILYWTSQRKQHVYGNLASWMMVQAHPQLQVCFGFTINKTGSSRSERDASGAEGGR